MKDRREQDDIDSILEWRGDDPFARGRGRSRRRARKDGPEASDGSFDLREAESSELGPNGDGARGAHTSAVGRTSKNASASSQRVESPTLFDGLPGFQAPRAKRRGRRDTLDTLPTTVLDRSEAFRFRDDPESLPFDPRSEASIREAFPDAAVEFPDGAYCRIVHRLGDLSRDPELSGLGNDGLYFDLETCGFHGHPLFLIGIMVRWESSWAVIQLLARDYAEEESILEAFGDHGEVEKAWVSFNGKSFDHPFLRNRALYHRLVLPEPDEHRDLLHAARRVYKGVLPNCKLQTLESVLFQRYRYRDLPGGEIPEAYHDYVRTGEEEDMVRVLRHNREDLVTLARLDVHLRDV